MKMKTHKATQKRFKLKTSGRLVHNKQGDNSHLKANKNQAQKARKKGTSDLKNKTEQKNIIKLMNK